MTEVQGYPRSDCARAALGLWLAALVIAGCSAQPDHERRKLQVEAPQVDAGGLAVAFHDGATAPVSVAAAPGLEAGSVGAPDATVSTPLDAAQAGADAGANLDSLTGWAAVSGDGVTTTTGGAAGRVVRPTSAQQLVDYAASDEPLIIEIVGTFAVPRLQVNSDKTLVGVGDQATLQGGIRIRGASDAFVSNVIVRNLHVNAATSDVDGDGMQIYYAHHVWIDHCELYDAPDGNLDIVHAASWVTVSWTSFRYTAAAPDPNHRFSNLIGHTDGNDEDIDRLKVSFHHCHWSDGVVERMPRVRYGKVHVWNSLYDAHGNHYAVGAGFAAQLLLEANFFDGVNDPHIFYDGEPTAQIVATGNEYASSTGAQDTGQGSAFVPPYVYALVPASGVAALVAASAGPR